MKKKKESCIVCNEKSHPRYMLMIISPKKTYYICKRSLCYITQVEKEYKDIEDSFKKT